MKVIGITGGVGAGKSTVLSALKEITACQIIMADDVAKDTIKKGGIAYADIVGLLGRDILLENEEIDKKKMSDRIFNDEELRLKVNSIIHPKTKDKIKELIKEAEKSGVYDYVFVEAALLIEDHYEELCEEFWYIYADRQTRIERLMNSRGYTLAKCESIMNNQLSDEEFVKHCCFKIDNSGTTSDTIQQLKEHIRNEY